MRGTHAEGRLDGEGRNTAVPNRPCAAKTIKSAVTPDSGRRSKPAMVRTVGMGRRGGKSRKSTGAGKNTYISPGIGPIWEHRTNMGKNCNFGGIFHD